MFPLLFTSLHFFVSLSLAALNILFSASCPVVRKMHLRDAESRTPRHFCVFCNSQFAVTQPHRFVFFQLFQHYVARKNTRFRFRSAFEVYAGCEVKSHVLPPAFSRCSLLPVGLICCLLGIFGFWGRDAAVSFTAAHASGLVNFRCYVFVF